MKTGNVLVGIFAGLAAGALIGILFAPEKGSDTRKKVLKKGDDYVDALKEKFNEFVDNISEKYDSAKEDVSEFAEKAEAKSEEVKKDVKNARSYASQSV